MTHWSQSLKCAQVINCKGYVVSRQDTNRNNTKCSLSAPRHYRTTPVTPCSTEHFLKCILTVLLRLNSRLHKPQEKLFVFWMYWMMIPQFACCIETLWTFTANIRLHSFMSLNVYLEVTNAAEFLLTNVTRKPSTFIVWLQQMCLELIEPCKTVWTVSTWVRLCISLNTNMKLQFNVSLKQLPTVRTIIWSTVALHTIFMSLQAPGVTKTLVIQWTLVRSLSRVDSHVSHKATWRCKSLATNSTFKRFHSWMTSPVYCQVPASVTTFAAFCAPVFPTMNIHVIKQVALRWITFLTLSTWIHVILLYCTVHSTVTIQTVSPFKLFVTHST